MVMAASLSDGVSGKLTLVTGFVNSQPCTVLRDTGCSVIGVSKNFVKDNDWLNKKLECTMFTGTKEVIDVATAEIDTPFLKGKFEVCVLNKPVADVIVGNVPGVDQIECTACPAVTRAQASEQEKVQKALKVDAIPFDFDPVRFSTEQRTDPKLQHCFRYATDGNVFNFPKGSVKYSVENGLLYRNYTRGTKFTKQLLVPLARRQDLLKLAHDTSLSGHMGITRTKSRLLTHFYWPCLNSDVRKYCKTCDLCQKKSGKTRCERAPMQITPLISAPFRRVAIDLIGPLPKTTQGNRFALTFVDFSTRWPEAVPLKETTTPYVAEALLNLFCRLGIPEEILSDNGPQFVSELMTEVMRLMGIRAIHSTPYHPQTTVINCESVNGVLTQMLKKVAAQKPNEWDRLLPAVLFAYREVPQETTNLSPFEMLYGRQPRGPLALVKQMVSGEVSDENIDSYQYVVDLKDRLKDACDLASANTKLAQGKNKKSYDKSSKLRKLAKGDKVLLLLPDASNKLIMSWKGPFVVTDIVSPVNFKIDVNGQVKLFHINMLKRYETREEPMPTAPTAPPLYAGSVGLVYDADEETDEVSNFGRFSTIPTPSCIQTEGVDDVVVRETLSGVKKDQARRVLSEFTDCLTDVPGRTNVVSHDIQLTTVKPVSVKRNYGPFNAKEKVIKEVREMLRLGIIEESTSPYCAPIVVVPKKDGSIRLCIDYRQLNAVTVPDAEPIPNPDDLFARIGNAKYFTKIDLTKGYWQVKLTERSKIFTAFQTPLGLMQFVTMPFGLVNAPSTFARLMCRVLGIAPNVQNYFDDILIHHADWDEHLRAVRSVFSKLREAGLTARPSKTLLGYEDIDFLGHVVGHGMLRPDPGKLNKMIDLQPPRTKKEVRSVLGLIGYYRKFIPQFAALAAPLTDLTKGGAPDKVKWNDHCQSAFINIKKCLSSSPILTLPDLSQKFVLRTDACQHGLGAVLLQDRDGLLCPIQYASKKLLEREVKYSTIEKECFAIFFGITHFSRFLLLTHFLLQTDHKPLLFLEKNKTKNARLARWSLKIAEFNYTIEAICGRDNCFADVLSRLV